MKRILSVDWDYFINASDEERLALFPDGGNEELSESIKNFIWDSLYRDPKLKEIGIREDDYSTLVEMSEQYFDGDCIVADSHKHIYDAIMEITTADEEFEVINIDFHHDLYDYRTREGRVNCGNWGTILKEDRPNCKFVWVKHPNSDTRVIGGGEVDAEIIEFKDFIYRYTLLHYIQFDLVYLCRSAMWSPPHLDQKFIDIVNNLAQKKNNNNVKAEQGITSPREYE